MVTKQKSAGLLKTIVIIAVASGVIGAYQNDLQERNEPVSAGTFKEFALRVERGGEAGFRALKADHPKAADWTIVALSGLAVVWAEESIRRKVKARFNWLKRQTPL